MTRRLILILLAVAWIPAILAAGPINDKIQKKLTVPERQWLESLKIMSQPSIASLEQRTSPEALRKTMMEILGYAKDDDGRLVQTRSLFLGSREVDANGDAHIHRYIRRRMQKLREASSDQLRRRYDARHGETWLKDHADELREKYGDDYRQKHFQQYAQSRLPRYLGSLIGRIAVPVPVEDANGDDALSPWQGGSRLVVGDETIELKPFYPAGAMPTLCPAKGLQGRLVYVGSGTWEELQGLNLQGAIAVMNFEGARRWLTLATLGAQAVVAIEDSYVGRENAEKWFCNTPVAIPRFYVDRETGRKLKKLSTHKTSADGGEQKVVEGSSCKLLGGNIYRDRPFESMFYYIPPTDPVVYPVKTDDLLNRIALQYDVSVATLRSLNSGKLPSDKPGPLPESELSIPGQQKPYGVAKSLEITVKDRKLKVQSADLVQRIASDYGISSEALIKANAGKFADGWLKPGTQLTVPNHPESLMLLVPIDSVSAVPNAHHGAKIASNIAVLLATLEQLVDDRAVIEDDQGNQRVLRRDIVRRKGVIVGFMDAESIGGTTSRLFAETVQLFRGELSPRYQEDPQEVLGRYREVAAWWRNGAKDDLDEETARWFVDDWLTRRVEAQRVTIIEEEVIKRRLSRDEGVAEQRREEALQRANRLMDVIWGKDRSGEKEGLIWLRDTTLNDRSLSWTERARSFLEKAPETIERAEQAGIAMLAMPRLQRRFATERRQEETRERIKQNNRQAIEKILAVRRTDGEDDNPIRGWQLDITDGTHMLGISHNPENFRVKHPGAGPHKEIGERYREVLAYAASRLGWPQDLQILTDADQVDLAIIQLQNPPFYPEFWAAGEVSLLSLITHNDTKPKLDTPRDTLEHVRWDNLRILARSTALVLTLGVENPTDSLSPKTITKPEYGRLMGMVTEFNMRSGIDAQDPVPGTYVYYPATKDKQDGYGHNTMAWLGTRRSTPIIAPLNGIYRLPLEDTRFKKKLVVYGYKLDPNSALFDKVVDQGQIGSQKQNPKFKLIGGEETEKKLILTEVYPWMFYPGVDPREYKQVGETVGAFEVIDVIRGGEPKHYALDAPKADYAEVDLNAIVLYMPIASRVRVAVRKNITTKMVLCGWVNPNDFEDKGKGYPIGPRSDADVRQSMHDAMLVEAKAGMSASEWESRKQQWEEDWQGWYDRMLGNGTWERNISLPMTPVAINRDMLQLAKRRKRVYQGHGISDKQINESIVRAEEKYERSLERLAVKDYQGALGSAREGWGILVKSYPRILQLGRQAVFSVVVLMALLVPASVFLEKLIVGSKGIIARLVGTVIIFSLGTIYLNFVHPAFKISVSPFIVMIAFTMILMSLIVLMISYQRFDVLLRRARAAGGEVESEEISLASSLATALSLGVSNLKKRPARTALTIFTVTVLTFSIVTFVSVRGEDRIDEREISLDTFVEGREVDPIPPKYDGVLFRQFYWLKMDEGFVDAIRTEFGARYDVTARGHYIQQEGGNNANREGVNREEVKFPANETSWTATGIMAYEPEETRFSHLNEAVTYNEWFRDENPDANELADRYVMIIPDVAAEKLGITPQMIYRTDANGDVITKPDGTAYRKAEDKLPVVRVMNRPWKVIGILDTKLADRMRDVNGKSLAMVDYLRSAFASGAAGGGDLANEPDSYHTSWEKLVIVPLEARSDAKIKLRSVAIRLRNDRKVTVDQGESLQQIATKYMGDPGRASLILAENEDLSDPNELQPGMEIVIPGDDTTAFRRDVALRMNKSMFGYLDGQLSLITTQTSSSVAGLAKIIVPVILCILIVLNTMMANVEERKGEVSMLGAIGLSPSQISFLLLSESMVFSVLGIVLGTFIGLLFANIISHAGVLQGLSVNFTSISSMALAMGTGLVVLVATLIPARKAAALAAPSGMAQWELPEPTEDGQIRFDLPFTLTRGNAVGMMMFFRRFLLNHTDAASADFNCRDIHVDVIDEPDEQALEITARMWLSPYDLDVAQDFRMRVIPTDNEGVFSVYIILHRTSGTEDSWLRTNYGFMDLVRRQFLLWRNLDNESRKNYIAEGAQLFQEAGR